MARGAMARPIFEEHPGLKEKLERKTVFLPAHLWERLDDIAKAETARFRLEARSKGRDPKSIPELGRNDIIRHFLEQEIADYDAADERKK